MRSGSTRGTRAWGLRGDRETYHGRRHVKPEPLHARDRCPGSERVPHGLQVKWEEEVFVSGCSQRARNPGVGLFGASKKRPGASRGANRDAKLSTHLIVVVDAVVVFARALWLERMIAGLVNRRPRGASRDCEDRRGIGRAMSRGEVSWARNEKVDYPVRWERTVLRAVLGVFARRSNPPSSTGRCGCVRGGERDRERRKNVRSTSSSRLRSRSVGNAAG